MKKKIWILSILVAVSGVMVACSGGGPRLTGLFSDGAVSITSVPDNAAIYVDEGVESPYDGSSFRKKTRYGNTPQTISLTEGDHLIRLRKKGFKDFEQWVNVGSGGVTELRAVMEPSKPE